MKNCFFDILFLILIGAHWPSIAAAQNQSMPPDSMGWGKFNGLMAPLQIPLVLSGNFGELREDHFHTGLDFKTEGREGLPVIAANDGVVARIKVSPFGYGRAIYLQGAEGITTVYAHLQRFAPALERWVVERQYERQRFELDESPAVFFMFSQGDTLGWSGNSGGSGGPHLHFEVRETATQRPINPFFWGFDVADARPPEVKGLWVMPLDGGQVNGLSRPVLAAARDSVVRVKGPVRFAVEALDQLNAANNRCGIYRAELQVDSCLFFAWELDTLDFAFNRDMNAHAVYETWKQTGEQVHRLHRLPGNRLRIYEAGQASGVLTADSGITKTLMLDVWDVHGNRTSEQWELIFGAPLLAPSSPPYRYDRSLDWEGEGASVRAEPNTFYEDFEFTVERNGGIWRIGNSDVPMAKSLRVELPIDSALQFGEGLVVVRLGASGNIEEVLTGECTAVDRFEFSTRRLGRFQFATDTIGPRIRPHKRHRTPQENQLVVQNFGELRFDLADELSGIASWHGALNGEWVLFRWDPKRERIWYELEDGAHQKGTPMTLEITAQDEAGNATVWQGTVAFQ